MSMFIGKMKMYHDIWWFPESEGYPQFSSISSNGISPNKNLSAMKGYPHGHGTPPGLCRISSSSGAGGPSSSSQASSGPGEMVLLNHCCILILLTSRNLEDGKVYVSLVSFGKYLYNIYLYIYIYISSLFEAFCFVNPSPVDEPGTLGVRRS